MQNTLEPTVCEKAEYKLENDKIRLVIDKSGSLTELRNMDSGHNYSGTGFLWRLYFRTDKASDREVLAADNQPEISVDTSKISLKYTSLAFEGSEIRISLEITGIIVEDEVHWAVDLKNNEVGVVVTDFHFPTIRVLRHQEQGLLWSKFGGQWLNEPENEVKKHHSLWMGQDQNFIQMKTGYPGRQAATNCFVFADGEEGLYFGLHETSGEITDHIFRLYGDELDAGMVRFPFCECGDTWRLGGYCLSPYSGSWHVASRKYRSWAERTWYRPHVIPDWVKECTGWQRVILKHQYGEIYYRYEDLPQLYRDGHKAGIDTLFLFGWQSGGHDNNYPDYEPDPDLGSVDELKQGIDFFRKNEGHVILYGNGQLIDLNSSFYREHGKAVEIKDFFGNTRHDTYCFRGNGCFTGDFANRSFVHACPYSDKWKDVLTGLADKALELGCSSVFYDQIGRASTPCFSPDHGHAVPAMDTGAERMRTIIALREHVRTEKPEMAVGIEILADITAVEADYVHSMSGFCAALNNWEETGEKPQLEYFIDWFRYTFPEIVMTDREIRDDTDIRRRVNHLALKGLRSDVEIYRCRRSIAETPDYQQYLGQVNEIRQELAHLLLAGTYRDTDGFSITNSEIEARSFVNGDEMAVVLTQSHLAEATTSLEVAPEWNYYKSRVLSAKVNDEGEKVTVTLNRHGLAVVVFRQCCP